MTHGKQLSRSAQRRGAVVASARRMRFYTAHPRNRGIWIEMITFF
jgi:hypothetical protein